MKQSPKSRESEEEFDRQRCRLAEGLQNIVLAAGGGLGFLVAGMAIFQSFGVTLLSWPEFLTVAGCLSGATVIYATVVICSVARLKIKIERAK